MIKTKDLFNPKQEWLKPLFETSQYPWEILPDIKSYIAFIISAKPAGFVLLKENVLVGANVDIAPSATIVGPAIICNNVQLRPGSYIRENVILCDNVVLGNSCEVKNSILLDHATVPHFNYVGDSILGEHAHMGAGAICSNLKSDNSSVKIHADKTINTNMRKVGAFIGAYSEIGCNSVLNPGTIIGEHSTIYPLSNVRGIVPPHSIYKQKGVIVEKQK